MMKNSIIFAVAGSASALLESQHLEYMNYISQFAKSYDNMEQFNLRLAQFNETNQKIKEHNARADLGEFNFWVGHNKMTDWTAQERDVLLGEKGEYKRESVSDEQKSELLKEVPTSWDWRWHNAVTAVKDQGSCGSCWTFGACSAIEGAHAISTGQLLTFSEQFFLDCVPAEEPYLCEGCNGGWAAATYNWMIAENYTMITEGNYKY